MLVIPAEAAVLVIPAEAAVLVIPAEAGIQSLLLVFGIFPQGRRTAVVRRLHDFPIVDGFPAYKVGDLRTHSPEPRGQVHLGLLEFPTFPGEFSLFKLSTGNNSAML